MDETAGFARTPKPPYYAAIFTSRRSAQDPIGYAEAARRMLEVAAEQPGFLGVLHFLRQLGDEGRIDAELLAAHQHLARQLEQDAFDGRHGGHCGAGPLGSGIGALIDSAVAVPSIARNQPAEFSLSYRPFAAQPGRGSLILLDSLSLSRRNGQQGGASALLRFVHKPAMRRKEKRPPDRSDGRWVWV